MKVELISYTDQPDYHVYRAARCCYQSGDVCDKIENPPTYQRVEKFIGDLIKSGHTSTLEHCSFTFAVSGISRVVSHELVRHRIASYSQQSQRYVNYRYMELDFYIPESIANNAEALRSYDETLEDCFKTYKKLIDLGVKAEDARYVLPSATPTQLVCTMNARSLLNFFTLRCCKRAQPEMRELANKMLKLVKEVAPIIFKDAGAACVRGECREVRKCD